VENEIRGQDGELLPNGQKHFLLAEGSAQFERIAFYSQAKEATMRLLIPAGLFGCILLAPPSHIGYAGDAVAKAAEWPSAAFIVTGDRAHKEVIGERLTPLIRRKYKGESRPFARALNLSALARCSAADLEALENVSGLLVHSEKVRKNLEAESLLILSIVKVVEESTGTSVATPWQQGGSQGPPKARHTVALGATWYDLRPGYAAEVKCDNVSITAEPQILALEQAVEEIFVRLEKSKQKLQDEATRSVVLNLESHRFHRPDCRHSLPSAQEMSWAKAVGAGAKPCRICFPTSWLQPSEMERSLGLSIADLIEERYRLCHDLEAIRLVESVGNTIIKGAGLQEYQYAFNVLESDEINAFAAPGGLIYVCRGVLDICESPDELALILGHLIAHIEASHGIPGWKKEMRGLRAHEITWGIIGLAAALEGRRFAAPSFPLNLPFDIVERGYGQDEEMEADRLGAFFAARAGYSAEKATAMIGKLEDIHAQKDLRQKSFLQSHGENAQRVKGLREAQERVRSLSAIATEVRTLDASLADVIDAFAVYENIPIEDLTKFVAAVRVLP